MFFHQKNKVKPRISLVFEHGFFMETVLIPWLEGVREKIEYRDISRGRETFISGTFTAHFLKRQKFRAVYDAWMHFWRIEPCFQSGILFHHVPSCSTVFRGTLLQWKCQKSCFQNTNWQCAKFLLSTPKTREVMTVWTPMVTFWKSDLTSRIFFSPDEF